MRNLDVIIVWIGICVVNSLLMALSWILERDPAAKQARLDIYTEDAKNFSFFGILYVLSTIAINARFLKWIAIIILIYVTIVYTGGYIYHLFYLQYNIKGIMQSVKETPFYSTICSFIYEVFHFGVAFEIARLTYKVITNR